MKIFLDTMDLSFIESALPSGLIEGITINPSIIAETDGDLVSILKDICTLMGDKSVHVEVIATNPEKVYQQAHALAKIGKNIVVKIPCHQNYYPIVKTLLREGITVNGTALFSVFQGVCMAQLGAQFISPFVGRCDESGDDGIQLLYDLHCLFKQNNITNTQILAASLRTPQKVCDALLAGANIVTLSPKLFTEILHEARTDETIKRFSERIQKAGIIDFP